MDRVWLVQGGTEGRVDRDVGHLGHTLKIEFEFQYF